MRIPYFAAAVEARQQPDLAGTPFLLGQPADAPREVFASSARAAASGVAMHMPLSQARALSPDARLLPAAPAHYRRALAAVLDVLSAFSPAVEAPAAPELRADARRRRTPYRSPAHQFDVEQSALCYVDLERLTASEGQVAAAHMLQALRQQASLEAVVGLAGGRFPAYAASLAQDYDVIAVEPGSEGRFLAGYPAALLPVDGEILRQLDLLGLHTLGQIAALPPTALADRFGRAGGVMHRLAAGRDTSRVSPYQPRRAVQAEQVFGGAVESREALAAACEALAGQLAVGLQKDGLAAHELALTLSLEDGTMREVALTLRQPTASGAHLYRTAAEMLDGLRISCAVSSLLLEAAGLVEPVVRQLSLFEREPVPAERLAEAVRALSARYEHASFYRLVLDDPASPLPEQRFRLERV